MGIGFAAYVMGIGNVLVFVFYSNTQQWKLFIATSVGSKELPKTNLAADGAFIILCHVTLSL